MVRTGWLTVNCALEFDFDFNLSVGSKFRYTKEVSKTRISHYLDIGVDLPSSKIGSSLNGFKIP